jgi:hypothetical protein
MMKSKVVDCRWLPGPLPNSRPLTSVIVQRAPKKASKHGPILSMTIHCRIPQSELWLWVGLGNDRFTHKSGMGRWLGKSKSSPR